MKLTFVSFRNSHVSLLLKWLSSPHVKVWWDPEIHWTLKRVKERYGSHAEGYHWYQGLKKPLQAFIICADNCPIGYIQSYNPRDYGLPLEEFPQSLIGLDFFIGEKSYLGKGLGVESLKCFLKDYIDPTYDVCFVDPNSRNHRAIHVYETSGFKAVSTPKGGELTYMIRTTRE